MLRVAGEADHLVLGLVLVTLTLGITFMVGRAVVLAAGVDLALTAVAESAALVAETAAEGGGLGTLGRRGNALSGTVTLVALVAVLVALGMERAIALLVALAGQASLGAAGLLAATALVAERACAVAVLVAVGTIALVGHAQVLVAVGTRVALLVGAATLGALGLELLHLPGAEDPGVEAAAIRLQQDPAGGIVIHHRRAAHGAQTAGIDAVSLARGLVVTDGHLHVALRTILRTGAAVSLRAAEAVLAVIRNAVGILEAGCAVGQVRHTFSVAVGLLVAFLVLHAGIGTGNTLTFATLIQRQKETALSGAILEGPGIVLPATPAVAQDAEGKPGIHPAAVIQ